MCWPRYSVSSDFVRLTQSADQSYPWVHFIDPDPTQPPYSEDAVMRQNFKFSQSKVIACQRKVTYICRPSYVHDICFSQICYFRPMTRPNPLKIKILDSLPTQPTGEPNPWTTVRQMQDVIHCSNRTDLICLLPLVTRGSTTDVAVLRWNRGVQLRPHFLDLHPQFRLMQQKLVNNLPFVCRSKRLRIRKKICFHSRPN